MRPSGSPTDNPWASIVVYLSYHRGKRRKEMKKKKKAKKSKAKKK